MLFTQKLLPPPPPHTAKIVIKSFYILHRKSLNQGNVLPHYSPEGFVRARAAAL